MRDAEERAENAIGGPLHISVGQLNERWQDLGRDRHDNLMCASGMRASVAAGWLASQGFDKLAIDLGSIGEWQAEHG